MDFSFEKVFHSVLEFRIVSISLVTKRKLIFFLLPLKTHSAYMLFYKRMEPEEENGRDYKFDVSSELLEVSRRVFKHHQKFVRIFVQICAVATSHYEPVSNLCRVGYCYSEFPCFMQPASYIAHHDHPFCFLCGFAASGSTC